MGQAWPNPAVGCVIESGGRILGRGWTQPGGRPHAEAMALDQAGARAQGATAHVTLEPCAHVSARGPACAGLLVAAGVARVVTALTDPDPRTAGAGHAHLRAAGIAVTTGVLADELRQDLAGFLLRFAQARPFVTLKLAATLDGRIATQGGESRWITGAPARALVHALRARHDAVMVGAGTVRADDPLLTVRGMGALRQPVRVVLSRALDLPADGALARSVPEAPLWLLHDGTAPAATVARWEGLGARLLPVASGPGGIDPAALRSFSPTSSLRRARINSARSGESVSIAARSASMRALINRASERSASTAESASGAGVRRLAFKLAAMDSRAASSRPS